MEISDTRIESGLSLLTERRHQLAENAIKIDILNKIGSIKNSETGRNNYGFSGQLVFVNSMSSINNPLFSIVEDPFTALSAPPIPPEAKFSDFIECIDSIPISRNELLAKPPKENPYLPSAPEIY